MNIKTKTELNNYSFIHFDVAKVEIDTISKSISFKLSGADYFENNNQYDFGAGYFEIKGYDELIISSYDVKNKIEKSLNATEALNLEELCEIEVLDDELIVKGFESKSNHWLEYTIIGGLISGKFSDSRD